MWFAPYEIKISLSSDKLCSDWSFKEHWPKGRSGSNQMFAFALWMMPQKEFTNPVGLVMAKCLATFVSTSEPWLK